MSPAPVELTREQRIDQAFAAYERGLIGLWASGVPIARELLQATRQHLCDAMEGAPRIVTRDERVAEAFRVYERQIIASVGEAEERIQPQRDQLRWAIEDAPAREKELKAAWRAGAQWAGRVVKRFAESPELSASHPDALRARATHIGYAMTETSVYRPPEPAG